MTEHSKHSADDPALARAAHEDAAGGNGRFGELGAPFDRRSPFRIGVVGGLGVAVAYVLWLAIASVSGVLLLMALALIIAIGLDPVVSVLRRWGVPRWIGVVIVSLGALAVLGAFLALAIAPIANEVNALVKSAPRYLQSLENKSSLLGRLNRQFHLVSDLKKALSSLSVSAIGSGLVGAGKTAVSVVSGILIVVVLTIYFLADMPRVKRTLHRLTPRSRRARTAALLDEAFARVGGYVLGNVLTSVIAGLGTLVWLEIFSVPYPALLSVFVGLMDLIPIVGSTIAGFVVALVALTVSVPVAVATAIFYIVYRNAEDYLITPRVMKRTVHVPGLVTVIAVLIGGSVLGIIGALIAIPVAAIIQLIVEESIYRRMDLS
ncbi:MAG: AI-2E family transporter [Solirubrobacteraceae bacterium]